MYINLAFELVMTLVSEKFSKVLARAYDCAEPMDEDEYIDRSLATKGITVAYRDSQYKKKVKLIVNPAWVLDSDKLDPDKMIQKLKKRVDNYFGSRYGLNDFKLARMVLSADIDVHDREKVSAYIKALQRVGKVKGFSPSRKVWFDDSISFSLDGNSNGISFMICDLEGLLREQLSRAESGRKQLKSIIDKSAGLLRAEVRLTEPKAIRAYTDATNTSDLIAVLSKKSKGIFLDTFQRIVPLGDFYKKDKAAEMIRKDVTDRTLRRRMLRLLELVPEKKSLLLAQKALNYRRVDDVMDAFGAIEVSPVTISKRHDVKKLDNLYKYM